MVGAAADRAGRALFQRLGQQARLCVQKRPFQPIPGGVCLGLAGGCLPVLLLCRLGGGSAALTVGEALFQFVERFPALSKTGGVGFQLHPAGIRVGQPGQCRFGFGQAGGQLVQRFAACRGPGGL